MKGCLLRLPSEDKNYLRKTIIADLVLTIFYHEGVMLDTEDTTSIMEGSQESLCVRLEDFDEGLERQVEVHLNFIPMVNSTTSKLLSLSFISWNSSIQS